MAICSSAVPSAINLLTQIKRATQTRNTLSNTTLSRCTRCINPAFSLDELELHVTHTCGDARTYFETEKLWSLSDESLFFSTRCEMTAGSPLRAVIHGHQFQALWIYMASAPCNTLRQKQNHYHLVMGCKYDIRCAGATELFKRFSNGS